MMTAVTALAAELVDHLREVVAFEVAGGRLRAAGLAVGAEVDREGVEAYGAEGGGPGDAADLGVGVTVDDDDAAVGGGGGGDPPGGDREVGVGALVAEGEGGFVVGEGEVVGGEAFEDPERAAADHARGGEEDLGHHEADEGDEGGADGEEDREEHRHVHEHPPIITATPHASSVLPWGSNAAAGNFKDFPRNGLKTYPHAVR
jgi:hypothetical protein